MRRKIACYITAAVTALFAVLRIVTAVHPDISLGFLSLEDTMIAVALLSMATIAGLCFTRSATPPAVNGVTRPFCGWVTTFGGALLIMSVILDVFCWTVYGQVPPPGEYILNSIDRFSLILSLVFGAVGGMFMILQGFYWMAGTIKNRVALSWLSLAPILWMWFRLARYEISYASTIDISRSFFDFASLVTASLFFLQLARAVTGVGAQSKNGLIVFSALTAIASLSGAPLTFYHLAQGEPVSSLLISLVDATIGLLAFAAMFAQAFAPAADRQCPEDDALAWTDPVKERQPLDPPFVIDRKLPVLEDAPCDSVSDNTQATQKTELSVEDILAELNKDIF